MPTFQNQQESVRPRWPYDIYAALSACRKVHPWR